MKKVICLLIVLIVALSLCACKGVKAKVEPKFFHGTWSCGYSKVNDLVQLPTTLVLNEDGTGKLKFGDTNYTLVWKQDPDNVESVLITELLQLDGDIPEEGALTKVDPNNKKFNSILTGTFTVIDGVATLNLTDSNQNDHVKIAAVLNKVDQ